MAIPLARRIILDDSDDNYYVIVKTTLGELKYQHAVHPIPTIDTDSGQMYWVFFTELREDSLLRIPVSEANRWLGHHKNGTQRALPPSLAAEFGVNYSAISPEVQIPPTQMLHREVQRSPVALDRSQFSATQPQTPPACVQPGDQRSVPVTYPQQQQQQQEERHHHHQQQRKKKPIYQQNMPVIRMRRQQCPRQLKSSGNEAIHDRREANTIITSPQSPGPSRKI